MVVFGFILTGFLALLGGFVLGALDCKSRFGIPRGVNSMEEWEEYERSNNDN